MTLDTFLETLKSSPSTIEFDDAMAVIETLYEFTPVSFTNGDLVNNTGQNSGSCKLFAFAKDQGLSQQETLHCFGKYYRDDVMKNPDGNDHQNIRNFMCSGWDGITFEKSPLKITTRD